MTNDEITLYRCTECGKVSLSHGWLSAHVDNKHRGYGPFNLGPVWLLPWRYEPPEDYIEESTFEELGDGE